MQEWETLAFVTYDPLTLWVKFWSEPISQLGVEHATELQAGY